jgi:hypothetical protein
MKNGRRNKQSPVCLSQMLRHARDNPGHESLSMTIGYLHAVFRAKKSLPLFGSPASGKAFAFFCNSLFKLDRPCSIYENRMQGLCW